LVLSLCARWRSLDETEPAILEVTLPTLLGARLGNSTCLLQGPIQAKDYGLETPVT
jgi:hypothetical protein